MKCNCIRCKALEAISHDDWNGFTKIDLFIGGVEGDQMLAATITIQVEPLMVSPDVVSKVMIDASKELSKSIANFAKGQTVN